MDAGLGLSLIGTYSHNWLKAVDLKKRESSQSPEKAKAKPAAGEKEGKKVAKATTYTPPLLSMPPVLTAESASETNPPAQINNNDIMFDDIRNGGFQGNYKFQLGELSLAMSGKVYLKGLIGDETVFIHTSSVKLPLGKFAKLGMSFYKEGNYNTISVNGTVMGFMVGMGTNADKPSEQSLNLYAYKTLFSKNGKSLGLLFSGFPNYGSYSITLCGSW